MSGLRVRRGVPAVFAMGTEQITRHGRHQRARENERADQREHHGFRQRPEQIAGHAAELEHRREHDVEHKQRDKCRNDDLLRAVEDRRLDRFAHFKMVENVLQRDGAFVDQHADGKRESAERHHVDGLAQRGKRHHREQDRQRDRNDDDHRRTPAAEE